MKKRILCMILAALMLLGICSFAAAEGETPADEAANGNSNAQGDAAEIIEAQFTLNGVYQSGAMECEQISSELLENIGLLAISALAEDDDAGSLTSEKVATIIERLNNAILDLEPKVDISDLSVAYNQTNAATLAKLVEIVMNSTPESFVFNNSVGYTTNQVNIISVNFSPKTGMVTMRADYDKEKAAALAEIFPAGASGLSKTEIALAIHDYIALHTRYDYTGANDNIFNAYGALVNGLAVCQGYSILYLDLLSEMGVESYVVTSSGINHGWNIINTEAGWYHSDVTWDDPATNETTNDNDRMGFCTHNNFLKTQTEIKQNHSNSSGAYDGRVNVYGASPIAASAAHPNSGFWANIYGGMFYCGGKWFYNNMQYFISCNGALCSTPYGTARTESVIAGGASALAYAQNSIIFAKYDTGSAAHTGLMQYDIAGGEVKSISQFAAPMLIAEIAAGRLNHNDAIIDRGIIIYADSANVYTFKLGAEAQRGNGDINDDGVLNLSDVKLICQYLVDLIALSENAQAAADIDGSGSIGIADAIMLCSLIAGEAA